MLVAKREIITFEKDRKKNVKKNVLKRTTAMQPFRNMIVWNSSSRCSYFSCSLFFLCDIHWLIKEGRHFFHPLSCVVYSEPCLKLLWKVFVGQWDEAFLGTVRGCYEQADYK